MNNKIGENIARKRKELGWRQEDLAMKMGYKSKSTINKIELGINDIPQSKVAKFAEVLGTTPAYIMGWEKAIEENPVKMAQIHVEMIMDEDLSDLFEDFKKLTPEGKKMAKKIIHSMVDEEV